MKNIHGGTCYRCGKPCEPGDGHFEKATSRQRKKWRGIVDGVNFLVQHSICANRFRGTDVHYKLDPALLGPDRKVNIGPQKVVCPHCGGIAEPTSGDRIYTSRPDLNGLNFYHCQPCGAYVGCHKGTWLPFGTPANLATRRARMEAHDAFDPLWKKKMLRDGCAKYEARNSAYAWLAAEMGLSFEECHIGMFNIEQCQQVVRICADVRKRRVA